MSERATAQESKLGRAARTSLRIQEVAVELVIKNGLDGTTVEQICQAAEVSERTFFNHFKTKELAIIGDDLPKIDEAKARIFLAAPPGDIFSESMGLIPGPADDTNFHDLVFKRMQIFAKYPQLFAAHMGKLLATRDEHIELIFLRLRRTHGENMSDSELREIAVQISEIVASLFRSQVEQRLHGVKLAPTLAPGSLGESLKRIVDIGLNA